MNAGSLRELVRLDWGDHPFSAGRLLHLMRQKYSNGLGTTYFRDVVRPRILDTAPVKTTDPTCEIHVLTSRYDWLNLLWALKSFYFYSGKRYSLCIHEDGTLENSAVENLRQAFPDARLIRRTEADQRAQSLLDACPRSKALRDTNVLSLKVFDFAAFLQAERMMIFDCDILFFKSPTALLETLEHSSVNSLNKDWSYGYTVDHEVIGARLGFTLPPLINSGLGLLFKSSLNYDWIEEFLALPDILGHHHRIEQTLIALCSARFGFHMLPPEYDVYLGARQSAFPSRHYAGPTRPLMYSEGIRALTQQGFLTGLQ